MEEFKGSKNCLTNIRPTRSTRHRNSFFGKKILQKKFLAEFECPNYYHEHYGGNPRHGKTVYFWKDA